MRAICSRSRWPGTSPSVRCSCWGEPRRCRASRVNAARSNGSTSAVPAGRARARFPGRTADRPVATRVVPAVPTSGRDRSHHDRRAALPLRSDAEPDAGLLGDRRGGPERRRRRGRAGGQAPRRGHQPDQRAGRRVVQHVIGRRARVDRRERRRIRTSPGGSPSVAARRTHRRDAPGGDRGDAERRHVEPEHPGHVHRARRVRPHAGRPSRRRGKSERSAHDPAAPGTRRRQSGAGAGGGKSCASRRDAGAARRRSGRRRTCHGGGARTLPRRHAGHDGPRSRPRGCAAAAQNPICPVELLDQLVAVVPEVVLANSRAPEHLLVAGSQVRSRHLRAAVAANPSTPGRQLQLLGRDPDPLVAGAVASNPSTPTNVRRRARDDGASAAEAELGFDTDATETRPRPDGSTAASGGVRRRARSRGPSTSRERDQQRAVLGCGRLEPRRAVHQRAAPRSAASTASVSDCSVYAIEIGKRVAAVAP